MDLKLEKKMGPEDNFEYRNFESFNFDIEKFNFDFKKQSGELKTKWGTKTKKVIIEISKLFYRVIASPNTVA